jgi:RNA polymerase sigma-70 factor (ECF subfamily)
VATNYCLNAAQANRLRRGTSAPESDPEVALMVSSDPGPESMIERAEVAGIVRDAVDALPDSQRMAIVLNKYQGLSYVEIGDAMGLSAKAVKSLLMRARVKLREALLRCQLPGVEDSREAGR